MDTVLERALRALTDEVNLATGLTNSSDKNKAKDLFVKLHAAKIPLPLDEITAWAIANRWLCDDAKALGKLAASIASGRKVRITEHYKWPDDLVVKLKLGADQ